MSLTPTETLWHNAQRLDSPNGAEFSRSEIDGIVKTAISEDEVDVVERLIKSLIPSSADADLDAFDAAIDFDGAGRARVKDAPNLGNREINEAVVDLLRSQNEMTALENNRNAATYGSDRQAYLLATTTQIRNEIEVARRMPTIRSELSRLRLWDVFFIRDSEARRALSAIQAAHDAGYAGPVLKEMARESKYIIRLVENLPGRNLRTLRGIVDAQSKDVRDAVESALGESRWNDLHGR